MRPERWLVTAALAVATLGSSAEAATRRYAVIVAHAGDAEEGTSLLEFADDDGARYHEVFAQVADDVQLFAQLDASTQRLHPGSARIARVPRRADVLTGLADVFARARGDVAAGHEVVFYFVLVGHGKIGDGGEGYVALHDSRFTRTDIFQEVLAKSPATTNHLIVDACNAYYLVHRRGGETAPARKDAVQAFLARESLAKYPNTGVILSTSSEKDTHEWSVYRAGVFSHQLRSAIVGGADVDGDGEVQYAELSAFLSAANQHVTEAARIEVFARPPAIDARRPLVDLRAAKFAHWLHVPEGAAARIYLEDHRGVRYLDAHVGGKHAVVFGLVPSAYYYARTSDGTRELRLTLQRTRIDLHRAAMKPPAVSRRGAVEESFRLHLYEEPFDADYYRGFAAARGEPALAFDRPRWRPGPPDARLVDDELRRLNRRAHVDAALRARLAATRGELVKLLEARDHAAALEILRRVEAVR
jgi:hypothetical protein